MAKSSTYMDRAMRSSDRRYAVILGKMGYSTTDMRPQKAVEPQEEDGEIKALREQYQDVVGKRAFHGWDANELRERIEKARSE